MTQVTTSDYSPDRSANRLLYGGCSLLILGPCLLILLLGVFMSKPLVFAVLPREWQPVTKASYGESLVLVTTLTGSEGPAASRVIDRSALTSSQYYNYRDVRIGRIDQSITSHTEALDLAARYNAALVLWGSADSQSGTLQYSVITPAHVAAPEQFQLTFDPTNSSELAYIGNYTSALSLLHYSAAYSTYAYYGAVEGLSAAYNDFNSNPPEERALIGYFLALAYFQDGNATQAALTVADTLTQTAPTLPLLYLQAEIASITWDIETGIEAATAALELDPDLIELYRLRGELYYTLAEYQSAVADYDHILAINPTDTLTLLSRAEAYAALAQYDAALADYSTIIDSGEFIFAVYAARAELYLQLGDVDAALQDYGFAFTLDSAYDEEFRLTYANLLLENQRYTEALEIFQSSGSAEGTIGAGMVHYLTGDEDLARSLWENYYLSSTPYADDYNSLAWNLSQQGFFEPALPYAEEAVRLGPSNSHIIHTRGYVYLGIREYELALIDFDRAVQLGLSYPGIYRDMADAYVGLKRYDLAVLNYQIYLDQEPYAEDVDEVNQRLLEAEKLVGQQN